MTLENNSVVLELIFSLINNGQINCRIDLINNIVVANDINQECVVMQKVIENSNKTYSNCVHGLLNNIVKVRIGLDYMSKRNNFTEHKIDNDLFDTELLSEMGGMGRIIKTGGMKGMGGMGRMGGYGRSNYDCDSD